MAIHQIQGKSLHEALQRAKEELGQRAVVVNHRVAPGAVTLAVADAEPADRLALEKLRIEARALLERPATLHGPGAADVQRCLQRAGASRPLVRAIAERVEGRLDEGMHPLDVAAEELGSLFPIARARREQGRVRIMAFLGHSGVGKTTTIGKLATGLVAAGRRLAVASLEERADDELERLTDRLGVPLYAGHGLKVLFSELRAGGSGYDVVLLDTAGSPARDAQHVQKLVDGLERSRASATLDAYLVLPATASPTALSSAGEALGNLPVAGAVLTKLDETRATAPVLEHMIREALPVAFLCDGPDWSRHFHRPNADRFADLFLRGRVVR